MHADQVKKVRRKRRRGKALLVILLLLTLLAWYCERNLTRALLNLSAARANAMAAEALNRAAGEIVGEGVAYEQLVTVVRDELGCIRLLQANAQAMNQLASRVSLGARQRLECLEGQQVEVPLGAALGLAMLSGAGPKIRVSILPVGTVTAALTTDFCAAGINQTRHTVRLHLQCSVRLVLPTGTQTVTAESELAVAESIIVGEVPDSYVDGKGEQMLKLAP